MPTSFPVALDTLNEDNQAAINKDFKDVGGALEATIGITSSTVPTSHDYLIRNSTVGRAKAGIPADADPTYVAAPSDGAHGVNTTANKLAYRSGGAWYQAHQMATNVVTYAATMAIDASKGDHIQITPTDTTAMTISNPTNASQGQILSFEFLNSSGGAMGAITWGAQYKLGGAFTNPANTKRRCIQFRVDVTNSLIIEVARTAADI